MQIKNITAHRATIITVGKWKRLPSPGRSQQTNKLLVIKSVHFCFYFFYSRKSQLLSQRAKNHETLQTSCAKIIKDVNKIVKDGHIDVGGNEVPVEMHLRGDYKVQNKYYRT